METAVAQHRCKLLKMIEAREDFPTHFEQAIWSRLERTLNCASHREKLERMKFANSSRRDVGRTCPKGEEGIRKMLQLRHNKSLDYDDVYAEMSRDKGYGGMARQRKRARQRQKKSALINLDCSIWHNVKDSEVLALGRNESTMETPGDKENATLKSEYVRSLQ